MSWTDRTAIETIKQLRDEFNVNTFIETGTFKGINSFVQSRNFKYVLTCEDNLSNVEIARNKLRDKRNVRVFKSNSPDFLGDFVRLYKKEKMEDVVIIYLDAHFYDKNARNKFIVTEELKALKGFKKCIVIIHDFNNGMGHIEYEGKTIDIDMVGGLLKEVNPGFRFYTNTPEFADIHTIETLSHIGLASDREAQDNIRYAWSKDRLTKRGILYAVPKELDLNKYRLKKWN